MDFDEALCDIMPMDCCHILLGRPWQYDRYVAHDGRLNEYTLRVSGKKQILLPLIESPDEIKCTIVRVCMVNEKEIKKNQVYFSIIPRRPSCASSRRASKNSTKQVTVSGN